MSTTKDDVRRWVEATGKQVQNLEGQPDLQARMRRANEGFRRLLGEPFVDETRYQALVGDVYGIFIDRQRREFDSMPRRQVDRLVLDTDPRVIAVSERTRAEGESDLYHERDTQGREEAYLFIRYAEKGGRQRNAWVEVANEESNERASVPVFLIGGILKGYSERGTINEASVYHYHPDTPQLQGMHESRISSTDLTAAAQYQETVERNLPVRVDFRVVNRDGIYTFSGVTFEKLQRFSQVDLYRVNALEGDALVRFLRERGIGCSFEARERRQPVRQP